MTAFSAMGFLADWYSRHCDGNWEHRYGVEIGTLDNPGWSMKIDLADTELEGTSIEKKLVERSGDDWICVWADGQTFQVACGPRNLDEALQRFQEVVLRS